MKLWDFLVAYYPSRRENQSLKQDLVRRSREGGEKTPLNAIRVKVDIPGNEAEI